MHQSKALYEFSRNMLLPIFFLSDFWPKKDEKQRKNMLFFMTF
jgi:hypothetical protein